MMRTKTLYKLVLLLHFVTGVLSLQTWLEQPRYTEVNPGGQVTLACLIQDKKGDCRWEKNGEPVGIESGKYEWTGPLESGDCSLKISDADLKFDDASWQCQVAPSSFDAGDALVSEAAQLVVREKPTAITIQRVGDEGQGVTASAGEEIDLECIVSGANPAATIHWFSKDQEIRSGHSQENSKSAAKGSKTWVSISRLTLPVSKGDNGAVIRCIAEHPTSDPPLSAKTQLTIHYPPTVHIETSDLSYLEEKKDPATLRCVADANPAASVLWRKEGEAGIFSQDSEINFSPVTRHTAGRYSCEANNALGLSETKVVDLDVKYPPAILTVGPSSVVSARMNHKTVLTCEAEGNPPPKYQWLQRLISHEILVRGHEKNLVLSNVSYVHQGEFVCKAENQIRGEDRSIQSEPIHVDVKGAPEVRKFSPEDVHVQDGEEARIEVRFCSDPVPKISWHLGSSGKVESEIILGSGTVHGRFDAEVVRRTEREDCYVSSLKINGAHADDSKSYQLRLTNRHGTRTHNVNLVVRDRVSRESVIAVFVGAILTLLLFILICVYCCKAQKCCCCEPSKKEFKPADLESEKTDVESTHSSNNSDDAKNNMDSEKLSAIPPDAYYTANESNFNDSKESLRPSSALANMAEIQQFHPVGPPRIVYNDLCFPKTSNYGSMKVKKKNMHDYVGAHAGAHGRLSYVHNGIYS